MQRVEKEASDPNLWSNPEKSQTVMRERKRLEDMLSTEAELARRISDLDAYFELGREGEDVSADLHREIASLRDRVEKLETETLLSGENDARNAIVTIHPGAGGTESQDWAEMLLRMYMRWTERRGFKREVIDYQPGEEAGLKSVTLTITGEYAYGLLAAEAGVHRLVRISPFDQAARRHTSFASLYVWPELPEDVVQVTRKKYHEAFERLTTIPFPAYLDDPSVVLG